MTKPAIHDEKKSMTGILDVGIDEGFVEEKDSPTHGNVEQNGAAISHMVPVSDSKLSASVKPMDQNGKEKSGFLKETDEGISSLGSSLSDVEVNVAPKSPEVSDIKADDSYNIESEDLTYCGRGRCLLRLNTLGKIGLVLVLLYFFICSLDFLSSAFRLVAGKTAGNVFADSKLLMNPISGLMIGVLATVLLQSSSTSTSIIITMVSAGIIDVRPGIPIIMGANIGTTVTNTIVSLAHSGQKAEFKRAFAGATVHDVFNWLTVLVLLPLEVATGCLYELTKKIVSIWDFESLKGGKKDLLKTITKPLTKLVVQIDKSVIADIAGNVDAKDRTILKVYCKYVKVPVNETMTTTVASTIKASAAASTIQTTESVVNATTEGITYVKEPVEKCYSLFSQIGWSDTITGIILLVFSLLLLSTCLILIVKLLHSILHDEIAEVCKKTINADFPGRLSFLTGYVAILVGAGMTILVQSSSVFTSALTPLVGVGCLELERMFPLTLGSNIGTTATGVLAALAAPAKTLDIALQLALCHLFFNILGILIYYPIPFMRRIPLRAARFLGSTTAEYKWFAIFYLFSMFMLLPGFFFALSMTGRIPFIVVVSILFVFIAIVVIIKIIQSKRRSILPLVLQNWDFLPECFRSLAPIDRVIQRVLSICSCCVCANCKSSPEASDDQSVEYEEDAEAINSSPIVINKAKAKEQFRRVRTISRCSQDGNGPYQMLMPEVTSCDKKPDLSKRLSAVSAVSAILHRKRTLSGGDNGSDENLLEAVDKEVEFQNTELSFVDEFQPISQRTSTPNNELNSVESINLSSLSHVKYSVI
ncbi:hypothetical protein SNE40_010796 [Patella caerulea]|uniref:Uncharacterized protein n=1 Tax=Patella caerulea TaxID=87958 RepID=A0AAN8JWP8_PATCE